MLSTGTVSRLPATTPSRIPTAAGISACPTYARTTCAGVQPSALRTPIRRVAVPTAPATTLPATSTDITMPSSPKETRNGRNSAVLRLVPCLVVSQDWAPVRAPAGTAASTAARSAAIAPVVPASAKR